MGLTIEKTGLSVYRHPRFSKRCYHFFTSSSVAVSLGDEPGGDCNDVIRRDISLMWAVIREGMLPARSDLAILARTDSAFWI